MDLSTYIERWQNKKILVVGDIGVDEYVIGPVRRISPEAPVPILEVESEDERLGLAANVAQNIVSLGGDVALVGVVGEDRGYDTLRRLLKSQGVSVDHLVLEKNRSTTRKMRVMSGPHHIVRVDYEVQTPISHQTEKQILGLSEQLVSQVSAVVIQDYAKGVVTESLVQSLVQLFQPQGIPILVDPHRSHRASFYKGVDILKPNWIESLALIASTREDWRGRNDAVDTIGRHLLEQSQAKSVVMTRGPDGMSLFDQGQRIDIPTAAKTVFDVTGAGDTVIATLALAYAAKVPLAEACRLANIAAGIVVGQVGCVPCSRKELQTEISAN